MANVFSITPRAPDWSAQTSETLEDPDEPPEKLPSSAFSRSTIRHPAEQPSLLTKAILAQSDEETAGGFATPFHTQRRRSMTSNFSVASADLTSDTGYTSPSRVSTPSPPTHSISILQLHNSITDNNKPTQFSGRVLTFGAQPAANGASRKRCIQFACGAKPAPPPRNVTDTPPSSRPVSVQEMQEPPRRTSIKFACPARPLDAQSILSRPSTQGSLFGDAAEPPTTSPQELPVLAAATATASAAAARPSLTRKPSNKATATRPRFLRATSGDLSKDGSQFHEFASDMAREDDWIRNDTLDTQTKLTISDTLRKENSIRRLATEVEEEAQLEEDEDDEAGGLVKREDDEDDDDNDDDYDEDEEDNKDEDDENEDDEEFNDDGHDELDDYDAELEDGDSDGYHTDEETGFADSDDEDDGNENMILWTPSHYGANKHSGVALTRRLSTNEHHSDTSANSKRSIRRAKARPIGPTAEATDLPDSTDFVCGTLDEDRPLEDAFISCLAARRTEHLRVIPQDIDPSFPASDVEEDEEDSFNAAHQGSDHNVWSMDDLHHDQDRPRRQKGEHTPPRRFRSPPPAKRHQSPPPKARGRSPKLLFDNHSPRRVRSPAPRALVTPLQTPRQGAHIKFHLAGRPGLTQTKSLPKPAVHFRFSKPKTVKMNADHEVHMRGAIDIVKGLEKKRQRRREKFMQKYCDRARRGQITERKPLPGLGAERMKEVGLIMAGKKDQGNYVLSF